LLAASQRILENPGSEPVHLDTVQRAARRQSTKVQDRVRFSIATEPPRRQQAGLRHLLQEATDVPARRFLTSVRSISAFAIAARCGNLKS